MPVQKGMSSSGPPDARGGGGFSIDEMRLSFFVAQSHASDVGEYERTRSSCSPERQPLFKNPSWMSRRRPMRRVAVVANWPFSDVQVTTISSPSSGSQARSKTAARMDSSLVESVKGAEGLPQCFAR